MIKNVIISGFILLGVTGLSNAQDLTDALRPFRGTAGLGARAIAMGGAYTAISNDYSATFWNPAGLAQISKSSLYSSVGHLSHDADVSYGDNPVSNLNESYTRLDGLGFVFKVPTYRGSLVWAIGRNSLYSFDNVLNVSTGGAGEDLSIIESGEVHSWTGSVGMEISPKTSFGVSVNWLRGSDDYDFRETTSELTINQNFSPDYNGFSLVLGGLIKGDKANLGFSITAPTIYEVDDEWNVVVENADSIVTEIGFNEYRVTMPFKFSLGLSSNLGNLLWAVDLHLQDFSQIEFRSDIFNDGVRLDGEINRDIASELTSTVGYGLGLEYLLPSTDAKIRFGLANDPSPFRNDDGGDDRLSISTGASMLLDKQVKLDITYIRTSWERELSSDFFSQNIMEDVVDFRLLLSVSYRY